MVREIRLALTDYQLEVTQTYLYLENPRGAHRRITKSCIVLDLPRVQCASIVGREVIGVMFLLWWRV
jgi:hypothetical protein